jgi:Protein of unknown function (DUF2844)
MKKWINRSVKNVDRFRSWRAGSSRTRYSRFALASILALSLVEFKPAHAALGQASASIAADQSALGGTVKTISAQKFDVREIQVPGNGFVHEYVSRDGIVFALSWNTIQMPDLKQLLGDYYDQYLDAAALHRSGHHAVSFDGTNLVLTITKSQRHCAGQIYLPTAMPAGVTARDLRLPQES